MGLSALLGYASIGCWLFAQFPQCLENIRQQSSEGLALPFLLNWLLGDVSNLIGCILTHQLPFQTWLATYFCFVDFTLFSQYFYYRTPKSLSTSDSFSYPHTPRRLSSDRSVPNYRALSAVAANLAVAAAEQDERVRHTWHHTNSSNSRMRSVSLSAAVPERDPVEEEDDEVDEEALARLADSFHSESGGRSVRRKHLSWNQGRVLHSPSVESRQSSATRSMILSQPFFSPPLSHQNPTDAQDSEGSAFFARGRPLRREVAQETEEWSRPRADSSTAPGHERMSSRASRRSAGIVFLGLWALFGIGTFGRNFYKRDTPQSSGTQVGRVLSPTFVPSAWTNDISSAPPESPSESAPIELVFKGPESQQYEDDIPPSTERLIGRVLAWACTTLYLTSRLPQIWKNYVRKSVEGLSVYLFIFAFLGNFFYVASILTSDEFRQPDPEERNSFIRETVPYLLGSGGTLMFDVTIVMQAHLYKPRKRSSFHKHTSLSKDFDEEEASALLHDDMDAPRATRTRSGASTPTARRT